MQYCTGAGIGGMWVYFFWHTHNEDVTIINKEERRPLVGSQDRILGYQSNA